MRLLVPLPVPCPGWETGDPPAWVSYSMYRTLSQESRAISHNAETQHRVYCRCGRGGQDRAPQEWRCRGTSERTHRPLTSPARCLQTGLDSRPDLPSILHLCSYSKAPSNILFLSFLLQMCWQNRSQHLFPLNYQKVISPATFPWRTSIFMGV